MIRTMLTALATGAFLAACANAPVAPAPTLAETTTAPPVAAPIHAPAPVGRVVHVASVHDGDTFTDTAGVKYRVLVEDSCEIGTPGGARAQAEARQLLTGQDVTVTPIGKRSYDRELAYVTLPDGRDFADVMLEADHTAVYAGRNDASAAKVAEGRAHDANGRTCGTAAKTTTTTKARPAVAKTTSPKRTTDDPWVAGQREWCREGHDGVPPSAC
jgi:endonuclease YncB( thermonuclease family)